MIILTKEATDALLSWYETHKRDLPWRHDPTPYETWVSEIMLQQTRVEAVKKYYLAWMKAFPTVYDLARADEQIVFKLWEGLGYYSRAKNILKAARTIVTKYGGELPADEQELMKIEGIGPYTAGAIASISFRLPCPAVDGNVLRVSSRLAADPFDVKDARVRNAVRDALRPVMEGADASAFSQALFELGALVCVPDAPRCALCPVSAFCKAYASGKQNELPVKARKKEKRIEYLTVFVLRYGSLYVLKKRSDVGLLAGLYELPNAEGLLTEEEVRARFRGEVEALPPARHIFTHVIWEEAGYLVDLDEPVLPEGAFFATKDEIREKYSLPSAFSAYKKYCE